MTCSNPKNSEYPCLYPGCNSKQTIFRRPADLERHYRNIHTYEGKVGYRCDYAKCPRMSDPFTRKDHFRDHLIHYHKEDVWYTGSKKKYQEEKERCSIDDLWWRCTRCLIRCYIAKDGWICPNCRSVCEEDRIRARGKLPPSSPEEPLNDDAVSQTPDTWLVRKINSVSRSINIVAHAMETL
jgi:hypothetical protein